MLVQVVVFDQVYVNGVMLGLEKGWIGVYVGVDGGLGCYLWCFKNLYKYFYVWLFNDVIYFDLCVFKVWGGKLILYQGWVDEVIYLGNLLVYYEMVEWLMGGCVIMQDVFCLFMIFGENYILQVGGGVEMVDYLSYLEVWVEWGQVLDVLLVQKMKMLVWFVGLVIYVQYLMFDNVVFLWFVYFYLVCVCFIGCGDVNDVVNWIVDCV